MGELNILAHGGDLDVRESHRAVLVAVASAASHVVQPGHCVVVSSPERHHNGVVVHLGSVQLAEVSRVRANIVGLAEAALGHGGLHPVEVVSRAVEFNGLVESLSGVDLGSTVWSEQVGVSSERVGSTSTSVAVPVLLGLAWVVTLVRGGGNNVFVTFEEVHLWAPVATNLVSITVVVSTVTGNWISVVVHSWHLDGVDGSIARAADTTVSDIVLNLLSNQVEVEEVVWVKRVLIHGGEVSSVIVLKSDRGSASGGLDPLVVSNNPHSLVLSINIDRYGSSVNLSSSKGGHSGKGKSLEHYKSYLILLNSKINSS